jgi:hypothetical protein
MPREKAYYWPGWLTKSIDQNFQVSEKQFSKGQLALWRALNIYDDIIDGDNYRADLMSANHDFRKFLAVLYNSNLPPYFIKQADKIITIWEKINRQEQQVSKLIIKNGAIKIPKNLTLTSTADSGYQKSLLLAILPIASTLQLRLISKPQEVKYLFNFFRYALAAKQLADDASDWLSDLKNGQLNPVNYLVLEATKKRKIKLNLKSRPEVIYLLFADSAGPKTAKKIINLCQRAKKEASQLKIKDNSPIIKFLICPLMSTAQKVLNFKNML